MRLLFIALAALATSAHAQGLTVYRQGSTYSDIPGTGAPCGHTGEHASCHPGGQRDHERGSWPTASGHPGTPTGPDRNPGRHPAGAGVPLHSAHSTFYRNRVR